MPDQSMFATALAAAGQNQDDGSKKAGKSKVAKAKVPDMFQFIIRYEGDGIVDDNVAKLLKDYFASVQNEKATCVPAPTQETPKGTSVNSEQRGKSLPAPAPATPGPAQLHGPMRQHYGPLRHKPYRLLLCPQRAALPSREGPSWGIRLSLVCISPGLAASWSMVHAIVLGIAGAGRYCDGPVRFFTR